MATKRIRAPFFLAAAAWFACTALAQAQTGAGAPSARAPSPGVAATPWDALAWVERRYKIEALRFKARDETGIDWLGSDEVMVETTDAKGWTVSDEIGNIDSGDTHKFDPAKSCIVAVRPGVVVLGKSSVCDEAGEPAPLGFSVEFWEKDVHWFGFCNVLGPGPGQHGGPHCANEKFDDFIGWARLDFPAPDLEAVLPNVGDERVETVVLSPCRGDSVCGGWDFPDYSFTYRVTRLPDVRVEFKAVLDEAMQRSGARDALEAIVAGLRALREPLPRKVQVEKE